MSLFDSLFQTKQAAPVAPAAQAPAATIPAAPTTPAGTTSTAGTVATTPSPDTPLDTFKGLWENDPNAAPLHQGMNFDVTPQQLAEIAGKIDFASVVPGTIHERIAAGGEDAIKASMEMQNMIARAVYSQNAMATTKLVEAATAKANEGIDAMIERKMKLMGLAENSATLNPALSNPAVAPLVDVIQQRFVQKFPNASSAEINRKVNEYFSQVGAAFNPEMAAKATSNSAKQGFQSLQPETDWSLFLS